MTACTVEFSIFRFKPGRIDPPRFEIFRIEAVEGTTVLDALERIRSTLDRSLMYRHSCHHSSCGTCACLVNGIERLTCRTRLLDLGTETVRLEPLRGFERIGDLAVRMEAFYRDIEPGWAYLTPSELSFGDCSMDAALSVAFDWKTAYIRSLPKAAEQAYSWGC